MDVLNIPLLASEPLPILLHHLYVICKDLGRSRGQGGRGRKGKKEGKRLIVSQSLPGHDAACLLSELPSPLSHSEKNRRKKTISFCSSSRLWQSLLLVRLRRRGVVGGLGGSSDGGVVPASNCFQPYYSWQQASEEACKQATSFQLAASKPISHKKCLPFTNSSCHE